MTAVAPAVARNNRWAVFFKAVVFPMFPIGKLDSPCKVGFCKTRNWAKESWHAEVQSSEPLGCGFFPLEDWQAHSRTILKTGDRTWSNGEMWCVMFPFVLHGNFLKGKTGPDVQLSLIMEIIPQDIVMRVPGYGRSKILGPLRCERDDGEAAAWTLQTCRLHKSPLFSLLGSLHASYGAFIACTFEGVDNHSNPIFIWADGQCSTSTAKRFTRCSCRSEGSFKPLLGNHVCF